MTDDGIIDAWAQPAIKDGFKHLPEIARLFKQSGTASILETGVTPDEMVAEMDRAGVQTTLLSAWHRPGRWIFTNDEVAEFIHKHPGRFIGVAAVNLEKPVEAVRELDR